MIDISHKNSTLRYARASGVIFLKPETIARVRNKTVPKGDVESVARSAGIMVGKRTPEWMVFSHTLPLDWIDVSMEFLENGLKFTAEARTVWKTGLEMEVMTAVHGALLNAYDMLKPIQEDITMGDIRLEEKSGGKSDLKDHFDPPLSTVLITVSTKKKAGTREDKSGAVVREFLKKQPLEVTETLMLNDDPEEISTEIKKRAEAGKTDLMIFTGSCGPQDSDVLPAALRAEMDKEMPGIGEAMRQYGYQRTPHAMLTDQVTGFRGKMLLLALPGSSRGALESLQAVFPGVLHAFKMVGR